MVAANPAAARSATSVGTCRRASIEPGTLDSMAVPLAAASCIQAVISGNSGTPCTLRIVAANALVTASAVSSAGRRLRRQRMTLCHLAASRRGIRSSSGTTHHHRLNIVNKTSVHQAILMSNSKAFDWLR